MKDSKMRTRRQYIVDRKVQGRMIRAAALPMACTLIVALVMQYQFGAFLEREAALLNTKLPAVKNMFFGTLVFYAFALVAQVMIAVRVSNRVSGAAYRIRATLDEFRSGNRKVRAKVRRADLLTSFSGDVNEFLEWVDTSLLAAEKGSEAGVTAAPSSPRSPKTSTESQPV